MAVPLAEFFGCGGKIQSHPAGKWCGTVGGFGNLGMWKWCAALESGPFAWAPYSQPTIFFLNGQNGDFHLFFIHDF